MKNNHHLHAERYASIAVEEAEKAPANGSFGVGGLLIKNSGKVLKKATNKVIVRNSITDPTAHVEKQLEGGDLSRRQMLPHNCEMNIICSLDPCIMCTGAILRK